MIYKQEDLQRQLSEHGESIKALQVKMQPPPGIHEPCTDLCCQTLSPRMAKRLGFDKSQKQIPHQFVPSVTKQRKIAKKSQAKIKQWVRETLSNGDMPSAEFNRLAEANGITRFKLKSCRSMIGKYTQQSGTFGKFRWMTTLINKGNN
jgi:hypothetical protein